MQTGYRKEASHTFFTVEGGDRTDPESYMVKLLCGGIIPGILKCHLQRMDGVNTFLYDVTSLQTLRTVYGSRKLTFSDIRFIIEECIGIVEEAEEYLIIPDHLMIAPDSIFADPGNKHMYFCCCPDGSRDIRVQLREIGEYILPRIDHRDREAMEAGYGFYRLICDDSVPVDSLRKAVYDAGTGSFMKRSDPESAAEGYEKPEETVKAELFDEEFVREDYQASDDQPEKQKPGMRIKSVLMIPFALAASLLLIIGLMHVHGNNRAVPTELLIIIIACIIAAGTAAVKIYKHLSGHPKVIYESVSDRRKYRRSGETEKYYAQNNDMERYTDLSLFRGYQDDAGAFTELEGPEEEKNRRGPVLIPEINCFPVIVLEDGMTIVGSLPGASDIVISSGMVSRMHARISKSGEAVSIKDLHSRNGTFLNGNPLDGDTEVQVRENDTVAFADVKYTLACS